MPTDTKEAILQAFYRIADKKPIEKITVKDIVAVCGITRQTFYYHFQDMIGVAEYALKQRSDLLLEQTLQTETLLDGLRCLVMFTQEHPEVIQYYLRSEKKDQAERLLHSASNKYFMELLQKNKLELRLQLDYSELETAATFFSYALFGVMLEEYRKKESCDPDKLAELLYKLVLGKVFPEHPSL